MESALPRAPTAAGFGLAFEPARLTQRKSPWSRDGSLSPLALARHGTASSMACVAEALGLSPPGTASIPAVHADRLRAGEEAGRLAGRLCGSALTPSRIVTPHSIENALRVLLALSGSTNAVIHLAAIAGRAGLALTGDMINRLSDETPVLVDLKPVGDHYMEDFHAAGGLDGVLRELEPLLHHECLTISGETIGARIARTRSARVEPAVIWPRIVAD